MEPLIISPGEITPEIRLGEGETFLIAGRSIPENPEEIFKPVIDWLHGYLEEGPDRPFTLEFRLEYMNSGSTKYILEILRLLKDHLEKGHSNITLKWYFEEEDESIEEMGLHFRDYLELPMEVIAEFG